MSFKRLLLSIPLFAAVFFGCNEEKDPEPLNVLPAGPLADFRYSGGRTYPGHSENFVEYLYTNDTVVTFENLSQNATNYLWNFGDPNSGAANTSTELNPVHTFSEIGNYVVNLTAYKIEGADTLGTFTASRTVRITFPRYKLLGKYAMSDSVSSLNSMADSIIAGNPNATPPTIDRVFRQDYTATISVQKNAASDSNKVHITTLETPVGSSNTLTRTAIATIDPNDPFKFTIPDQMFGTNDSILDGTGSLKGNTLWLKYTVKNISTGNTRYRHGAGNK